MALSARVRPSSWMVKNRGSSMIIMDDLIHNMFDDSLSERKIVDEVTLEEFLKEEEEEVRVKTDPVVVIESGRKRVVVDDPVDRAAAVQRQKRTIKNRESAAKSRERKQLMENLIPVTERRKPQRILRRMNTFQ